jgi:hypothetical protein
MGRLVLFALLVGCSSSEGTTPTVTDSAAVVDTSSPAETSPVIADTRDASCKLQKAYSSKDVDCNTCAEQQCCDEVNGCFADKRCDDDYVNCILACALLPADAADAGAERDRCVAECDSMHPDGKKAYDRAIGCVEMKCPTPCD